MIHEKLVNELETPERIIFRHELSNYFTLFILETVLQKAICQQSLSVTLFKNEKSELIC